VYGAVARPELPSLAPEIEVVTLVSVTVLVPVVPGVGGVVSIPKAIEPEFAVVVAPPPLLLSVAEILQ